MMIKDRDVFLLFVGIVLVLAPMLATWAETPPVDNVNPRQGYVDEWTAATLTGQGFEPGAGVALLQGGGFQVAGLSVSGQHLTLSDGYAYLAWGGIEEGGLWIVDVRDPAHPVVVGDFLATTDRANHVAVAGGFAYVSTYNFDTRIGDLVIVDVNDPATPAIVGNVEIPGLRYDVEIAGGYAYVAAGSNGLKIVDVGDPTAPLIVGSLGEPVTVYDVLVSDGIAYLGAGLGGMLVVDVGDPAFPRILGRGETQGSATRVNFVGGYLYVTDWSGITIFDVSAPTAPRRVGGAGIRPFTDLDVSDGLAYFPSSPRSVEVVDVSEPLTPRVVGRFPTMTTYTARSASVSNGYLYGVFLSEGLRIFDVGNAVIQRRVVGGLDTEGSARRVAVSDGRAYVVNPDEGLQIIDVVDPTNPRLLGAYVAKEQAPSAVDLAGGYVYLATYNLVRILDVSDPAAPTMVHYVHFSSRVEDFAVSGDYAYVLASGGYVWWVIDVSDPSLPRHVKSVVSARVRALDVADGYLYCALWGGGLSVVDVSDPENPVTVGAVATPGQAEDLQVAGGHAYMAGGQAGLQVVDVSDPENPAMVGVAGIPGGASAVRVVNGNAHIASGVHGLHTVDVSDPSRPRLAGGIGTLNEALGLDFVGGLAYVAEGRAGLQILRPNPTLESVRRTSDGEIEFTVPPGFAFGPYNVRVSNSEPEATMLQNGFLACEQHALSCDLEPLLDLSPPLLMPESVSWKMTLDGDALFFEPLVRHEALLVLPDLPTSLETRFEPGDGSGRMAVELHLAPQEDRGFVLLMGDDTDRITALWESMQVAGGCEMPRLDDRTYGELKLGLSRASVGGSPFGPPQDPVIPLQATVGHRFEFSADGLLIGARAWGADVDLLFRASGRDLYGCETTETVGLFEVLQEICRDQAAANPELMLLCP